MNRLLMIVLIATLAVLTGCETTPQVSTDHDPSFNFAGKTRVAVMRPEQALAAMGKGGVVTGMNDLLAGRLTHTIEGTLEARGYTIVPPAQADLIVSFMVATQNKMQVTSYNTGWGFAGCWRCGAYGGYGAQQIDVRNYTEGTLFIDVIDTRGKTLVWRGQSSKRLPTKASTSERDALAKEVVGAILAHFPPGSAP